jgi:hypothetical protein
MSHELRTPLNARCLVTNRDGREPRTGCLEPVESDILGDASTCDTNRSAFTSARLERKSGVAPGLGFLNSEIVPQIDRGSVACPGATIAAIVAPHQPDARIIIVALPPTIWRLLPRMVAEAYALALRARGANQFERSGIGFDE